MKRDDVPIEMLCGADWSAMAPQDAARRLCASCNTTVHDLSALAPTQVEEVLSRGPVCVRYLYDRHGNMLFGPLPKDATLVPAAALLKKASRERWFALAAVVGSAIVFEACGGNAGDRYSPEGLTRQGADPDPVLDAGARDGAARDGAASDADTARDGGAGLDATVPDDAGSSEDGG
jgi:hypothetical protein